MKWALIAAAVVVFGASGLVVSPTAAADDLQTRVNAADAYLATRPGSVGYVLRDRATGGDPSQRARRGTGVDCVDDQARDGRRPLDAGKRRFDFAERH